MTPLGVGHLVAEPPAPLASFKFVRAKGPGALFSDLLAIFVKLDQVDGMAFRLSPKTREIARSHLADTHEDVRFTAALVLADAGEADGTVSVLKEMLSRERLEEIVPKERLDKKLSGISRYHIHSNVIILAIGAAAKLKTDDPEIVAALKVLSDDEDEGDPDVREAARQALTMLNQRN